MSTDVLSQSGYGDVEPTWHSARMATDMLTQHGLEQRWLRICCKHQGSKKLGLCLFIPGGVWVLQDIRLSETTRVGELPVLRVTENWALVLEPGNDDHWPP